MDLPNSKNYKGIDNETLLSFRSMGLFTDVKFLVNGKELRAHKIVLATRSEVFQAMFSSDMAESHNHVTVNIEDMDDEVFTTFLDYMYTLDGSLVKSCPVDLLMCADKYNIAPLLSACDRFFSSTISKDNIFDYLDLSETFHRQRIKDSAINFLRANITAVVHDLEGWSRLQYRFETITHLVGSYSRFIDFKEYNLSPDFWVRRNVNESCLLNGRLSVEADRKNYSFTLEVERDARGECLSGIINLVEEYSLSVKVYVLIEIESNNQLLLHDKQLLCWSKMCSVDTSMDMECWRLVDGHPVPCMNTGPIIFMLPNASIFDQTTILKIALISLRPQNNSNTSTEIITPSELAFSEFLKPHPSSETTGFRNDFGLKSNFDFRWSGFCPPLTVESAPTTLCRVAKTVHQDKNDAEKLKHKVLQFMKFHAADIIKSNEWTTLQPFPDLLRDLLLEVAQ